MLLCQRQIKLFVFALSCGFRLLLTLNTRLFVVFSLAKFGEDAGTSALTFKATKGTVQGLAFLNSNFCHLLIPSLRMLRSPVTILFEYYTTEFLACQYPMKNFVVYFSFYFTTMLTILLGTEISLTMVFPSRYAAAASFAAAIASSFGQFIGISTLARTLPLI